jgi:hypothetical protein
MPCKHCVVWRGGPCSRMGVLLPACALRPAAAAQLGRWQDHTLTGRFTVRCAASEAVNLQLGWSSVAEVLLG